MAMRARCLDLQDSINADPKNPSGERLWFVDGIAPGQTLDDVLAHIITVADGYLTFRVPNSDGFTPAAFSGRIYRKQLKPAWISPSLATCVVTYGMHDATPHEAQGGQKPEDTDQDEACGPEISFSTIGGTQHVTQSKETRHRIKRDGGALSAPDVFHAIGVSRDKVEGCDIVTGDLKWGLTIKGVPVTHRWLKKIKAMTGTINDREFIGRAAEELLFLGASGGFRAGEGWVVTFDFLERENAEAEFIADGITFEPKNGHDYVWVMYEDGAGGAANEFSVQKPIAGYCERVYKKKDFRQIAKSGAYVEGLP